MLRQIFGGYMSIFGKVFAFAILSFLVIIVYELFLKNREGYTKEDEKRKLIDLLVVVFLGTFGVHKFVDRKYGMGILYLLTGGLFLIGWLVDVVRAVRSIIGIDNDDGIEH